MEINAELDWTFERDSTLFKGSSWELLEGLVRLLEKTLSVNMSVECIHVREWSEDKFLLLICLCRFHSKMSNQDWRSLDEVLDAMRVEFDQVLDDIFRHLHWRFDRIEKRDAKRRGSLQSTSSKSTYSKRKEKVHSTTFSPKHVVEKGFDQVWKSYVKKLEIGRASCRERV